VDTPRSWVGYMSYAPIGESLSARGWAGTQMRFTEWGEIEWEKFAFHFTSFDIFPPPLSLLDLSSFMGSEVSCSRRGARGASPRYGSRTPHGFAGDFWSGTGLVRVLGNPRKTSCRRALVGSVCVRYQSHPSSYMCPSWIMTAAPRSAGFCKYPFPVPDRNIRHCSAP
jgi:hypothetical protein